MVNILKLEFFRLKKSSAFWVCLGLCVGLPALSLLATLLGQAILNDFGQFEDYFLIEGGMFFYTRDLVYYSASCNIFAIICAAAVLGAEFNQGTVRNMIAANKKRTQIFAAFYVFALVLGGIFFLTTLISLLVFFGATFGFGGVSAWQAFTTLLCYFFMGLSATACVQTMLTMFLFTTKKTSVTLTLSLLFVIFVPEIIAAIVNLIVTAISQNQTVSQSFLECLPFLNWETLDNVRPSGLNVGMVILWNVLFGGLFFLAGYSSFNKADIK